MISILKERFFWDKFLLLFVFALFGIFRPDYVVIAVCVLMVPYLYLTNRVNLLKHFGMAFLISGIWVINARKQYHYNYDFIDVFGISLYPFFAWSAGLLGTYLIFEYYRNKLKNKDFKKQFFVYLFVFWTLLIFGEVVSYHLFDVRNLASASYSGLPICDCIHAPNWMKISYFLLGPLFFVISYVMGWENSKKTKKTQ